MRAAALGDVAAVIGGDHHRRLVRVVRMRLDVLPEVADDLVGVADDVEVQIVDRVFTQCVRIGRIDASGRWSRRRITWPG